MRCQRAELPLRIAHPGAARAFFAGCFAEVDASLEHLFVAHVDRDGRCLRLSRHVGDSRGLGLPLREIMLDAARHDSAGILLAHNHPSGDPTPSASDLRATRRLAVAAEAIGCRILDHLVFAGHECSSFRSLRYL